MYCTHTTTEWFLKIVVNTSQLQYCSRFIQFFFLIYSQVFILCYLDSSFYFYTSTPPGSVLFDCLIIFFILYQLLLIIRPVCDATLLCIHFASYSFYPCNMKKGISKKPFLACIIFVTFVCLRRIIFTTILVTSQYQQNV